MKKLLYASIIAAALFATWFQLRYQRRAPSGRGGGIHAAEFRRPAPDFHLTERSGREVSLADLKGKVWLASFIYTNCPGPCPVITRNLAAMQDDILALPGTLIVTFSLDPERDTPDALRNYADERRASPDRWLFLTGDGAELERVITNGFLVPRAEKPGEPIIHGTQLVLVDRRGDMRALYEGTQASEKDRILADVRRLLDEQEKP